jgi:hypothetical protein
MDLVSVHDRLANAMILYSIVAGLWGIIGGLRRRPMSGNYWGIIAIAELLFLGQALIGLTLWLGGDRPARGVHILYGVVAILSLPAYYAMSKGRDDSRAVLIYGLIFFFLVAIMLRAITTAV